MDSDLHVRPIFASASPQPAGFAVDLKVREASISIVRYPSGVDAVRLSARRGNMVVLPFQGQQISSASLCGRSVGMRSMFETPRATTRFLETYGGSFQHCGGTYVGLSAVPNRYGLHEGLPNAPYDSATLLLSSNDRGAYIGLAGVYWHTVAFSVSYEARPLLRFYLEEPVFDAGTFIVNVMHIPLNLAYLAHLNWPPVDNARIEDTTPRTPGAMRVRMEDSSHIRPEPGYDNLSRSWRKILG